MNYSCAHWQLISTVREIEADSEEEAVEKMKQLVESDSIPYDEYDVGEDGIEVVG